MGISNTGNRTLYNHFGHHDNRSLPHGCNDITSIRIHEYADCSTLDVCSNGLYKIYGYEKRH